MTAINYEQIQGCINAKAAKLMYDKEKLIEYMSDKTEHQKQQARLHLRTVRALKGGK